MTTLYAHPFSHNSRKVHWALEELGLPHQYELVDLQAGAQKEPAFLARNPNGRVPVVVFDDGLTLYESNAILLHLGGALVPADPGDAARVAMWLLWEASDLADAISQPWRMQLFARMGIQPLDEALHARLVAEAAAPLAVLDGALAGRSTVVGDRLSAADIALGETAGIAADAGIDMSPYANVQAWLAGLAQRPAFQKTRPQG